MPKGKGEDALTFAILFAAVTSLTPSECNMSLGEEKSTMVENFRTRTEQALANADFLNSVELVTLQALAIFLVGDSIEESHNSRLQSCFSYKRL